jgi:hypothetical protein
MRRIVPFALVTLLAVSTFGCGDVHLHGGRRPYHHRYHRVHHPAPPPRVVHVHTHPRPAPPRVVHVHTPPAPPPRVVVHERDRHPGRGHAYGHHKNHPRGRSDADLRIKAKGDKGAVDLRVRVDD